MGLEQSDQPDTPGAAPRRPRDSGQPDHEAVGVGVIHGPQSAAEPAQPRRAESAAGGGALDPSQEQRLPSTPERDAAELEKITGVVVQTRQDSGTEPFDRLVEVLRERLDQAGVQLGDGEVEELARQVSTGDAAAESSGESGTGSDGAG